MKIHFTNFLIFIGLVILIPNPSDAQIFSGGYEHSLFLCSNNIPMSCGKNIFGELGDGTTIQKNLPILVNSLTNIIAVEAGGGHSLFLKNDSTVWACGDNSAGQFGTGTTVSSNTPIQISSLTGIISIAAGGSQGVPSAPFAGHSLFLKKNGTVWACGYNSYGQLGDGTTIQKNSPVQITSLSGVIAISTNAYHSLFLKNDGTVWICGANSVTPVQFSSLTGIRAISAGLNHSLFLHNDGTVWSCGFNLMGQLGNGTTVSSNTPIQISSLTGIISIAAGGSHSLFLKADGTVWGCGHNAYGTLGNGAASYATPTPVQADTIKGIIAIAAGGAHSFFQKNDGTVFTCGNNAYGQLGDGTTSNKLIPVPITALCGVGVNIKEIPILNTISVFPNPANNIMIIKTNSTDLQIADLLDINGVHVLSKPFYNTAKIEVSNIDNGIYILTIKNGDTFIYKKVVVSH